MYIKKQLGLLLLGGAVLLAGCGEVETQSTNETVEIPTAFTLVSKESIDKNHFKIYTAKHNETGCYWSFTRNLGDGGVDSEQMFVEKNGVSVPYCEKTEE